MENDLQDLGYWWIGADLGSLGRMTQIKVLDTEYGQDTGDRVWLQQAVLEDECMRSFSLHEDAQHP